MGAAVKALKKQSVRVEVTQWEKEMQMMEIVCSLLLDDKMAICVPQGSVAEEWDTFYTLGGTHPVFSG